MVKMNRLASIAAVAGLAAVGVAVMPHDAKAWWRGGVGFGVVLPPVVVAPEPVYAAPVYAAPVYAPPYYVAPPVVYAPPPAYVAPAGRVWVAPHWQGNVWVAGHWS
jgi:hypothetical protein